MLTQQTMRYAMCITDNILNIVATVLLTYVGIHSKDQGNIIDAQMQCDKRPCTNERTTICIDAWIKHICIRHTISIYFNIDCCRISLSYV